MTDSHQIKDQAPVSADSVPHQAEPSPENDAEITFRDWLSYLAGTMLLAYASYLLLALWCSLLAAPPLVLAILATFTLFAVPPSIYFLMDSYHVWAATLKHLRRLF